MSSAAVHIVGAGIAGLSAAVRLVESGRTIVVHEAAAAAGGRCRSFFDPTLGATIDNGNHLLLSGNHTALDFLKRIAAVDRLSGPATAMFDFADLRTGERWRLRPSEGKAPWWLFDRSRRAPGTSFREYFAPLSILWASAHSTVEKAMTCSGPLYERLWRPLLLAGLNTEPEISSARLAAALLRETLFEGGRACRPIVATEGLSHSFIDPAVDYLHRRGAQVRFGARLNAIRFDEARAAGLDFDHGFLPLGPEDAVVIAVPPWTAEALLPGIEAPNEFRGILNAHYRIAPPPETPRILGVIGGTVQWLFAYPDRLSVTISAADELIEQSKESLATAIWREVARLTGLPDDPPPPCRIVKEKRATFAATPRQEARRPAAKTRWQNVALCGDWVQTGLPATIEGAVRSGYAAAQLLVVATRKSADLVGERL